MEKHNALRHAFSIDNYLKHNKLNLLHNLYYGNYRIYNQLHIRNKYNNTSLLYKKNTFFLPSVSEGG